MNTTAAAAIRRPAPTREWFASWFDSVHYHRLYAHRDEAEAAGLISRLIDRLRPVRGAAVLDLGCGAGRHSRRLAAMGFDVIGIDLSAGSIKRAEAHGLPNLRFRRQDMRTPFGRDAFDCVFNLFTSFGYFDDPADNVTVLHNIAAALKPGGALVLDYLNVKRAEAELRAEEIVERAGATYRISRWSDADCIYKRVAIDDPSAPGRREHVERVAKLTLDDFRFMFAVCGLRIEAVYGDYELAPFRAEVSPRAIVVARKTCGRPRLPAREVPANPADRFRRHAEIRGEH